ncbi:MAG: flavodoxin family protein [Prevotella sp.]|jgi:multimeric flavodoxin WrbA|nr:flavodoxin family protein [Prevotella sp.]MCH3995433.1 flavodoxin family protein [Prevotella sp.]
MTKVLLINGSPIKEGNTFIALSEVAKTLEQEGIETEILQLGNKPVRGCIACQTCKKKDNGLCTFDDDVCNKLCKKAAEADAFVFGSPVYWGQPNGALLAVIQRALYADGKDFSYKPFANVAVCRRGGATAAFSTMNMAFQMLNMPQVTSQYWNVVYGRTPGEASQDIEGLQTMRTLAYNMSWMLSKIKTTNTPARPKSETWSPMNFIR